MEDKVLETVVNGLEYSFEKDILVKPLAPIMVTKEYTEQIPTGEKDEEGFNKYEVKTHTKEVESDFAKVLFYLFQSVLIVPLRLVIL